MAPNINIMRYYPAYPCLVLLSTVRSTANLDVNNRLVFVMKEINLILHLTFDKGLL